MTVLLSPFSSASVIFWDFDGVIKESVEVKTEAFEKLFLPFGDEIAKRVKSHHENHGGVSRFDKIPLYLSWADEPVSRESVEHYCDRFSSLVKQAVIDSSWVPGVLDYLQKHFKRQKFILVTATPEDEIESILQALNITHLFESVYGAPTPKSEAMASVLEDVDPSCDEMLMVGDSLSDYEAAISNRVPFLLRCTPLNTSLQRMEYDDEYDDGYSRWLLIRGDNG